MRLTGRQPKCNLLLLEAMQEKQVTIGDETFILDKPFLSNGNSKPCGARGNLPAYQRRKWTVSC